MGIRVLKLGLTWPLEPQGLHAFALGLEEILVVEEKRPVIEDQVRAMLYHWPDARRPRVVGKRAEDAGPNEWLLPPTGELNAEQVALVIASRLERFYADARLDERVAWLRAKEEAASKPSLSPQLRGYLSDAGRVPYFCSGCPHNSSTRVPEGSEAIAGVGCHFMATYIFPGTKIFSPMGSEGAAWVGHAPFTDTPPASRSSRWTASRWSRWRTVTPRANGASLPYFSGWSVTTTMRATPSASSWRVSAGTLSGPGSG